jgi:hypothetical protein
MGDDDGRAYAVGIGQALALYRYGVDGVALWFVFFGEDLTPRVAQYGAQAWHFLRHELSLPLDFMFFFSANSSAREEMQVLQYTSDRQCTVLCSLGEYGELRFRPNPLPAGSAAFEVRAELVPWLERPAG